MDRTMNQHTCSPPTAGDNLLSLCVPFYVIHLKSLYVAQQGRCLLAPDHSLLPLGTPHCNVKSSYLRDGEPADNRSAPSWSIRRARFAKDFAWPRAFLTAKS
jgi:hypothetical protein